MRVLIVGAGIMGTATAAELAQRGVSVTLLERAVPGAEASTAAAGILGAQAESGGAPALLPLFLRAREAYVRWAQELDGYDLGFRTCGVVRLAFTDEEVQSAQSLHALSAAHGARSEWVTEPWRIEPHVSREARGAVYFPEDAQVEPAKLFRALMAQVARLSIDVRSGTVVHSLAMNDGRCIGAHTDHGLIEADATVLAAGSFSALVQGAPARVRDVRPIRGQMCELEERLPKTQTIVFGSGSYVVPRGDGRVVCGSTMEDVGFVRAVTAEGISKLLFGALRSVPSLAHAELVRTWCSFRPYLPPLDEQLGPSAPLMGRSDVPGLFLATGHHRNGILLAKVTAENVATSILAS